MQAVEAEKQNRLIRTLARKKDLWEANIKANTLYIKHDLEELWVNQGTEDGILIGAGPSLEKHLDDLREISLRRKELNFEICAVDIVSRYLLENGIEMDFVICTEAKKEIAETLAYDSYVPLIADVGINPEVPRQWKGQIFWYVNCNPAIDLDNQNRFMEDVHENLSGVTTRLVPGGNVCSVGLSFLLSVRQCKRVYLFGHDYSFKDKEKMYCGNIFQDLGRQRIEEEERTGTLFKVTDINGSQTYTTLSLQIFSDWFKDTANRMEGMIFNCSGEGILNIGRENVKNLNKKYEKMEVSIK